MGAVRVAQTFSGSVHQAETCWYDTSRWPAWVDGLAEVVAVEGDWPKVGSSVTWQSSPAGRGRVRERVVVYEPLEGQELEVEDDTLRGRQTVIFTPVDDGVEVQLGLSYQVKRRSPFTPIVDALFIRRAMAASLRKTLSYFGAELRSARLSQLG